MEDDPERCAATAVCNLMGALLPQLFAAGVLNPAGAIRMIDMFDQLNEGMIAPGTMLEALKQGAALQRAVFQQMISPT